VLALRPEDFIHIGIPRALAALRSGAHLSASRGDAAG
jgi:hypothetical protein